MDIKRRIKENWFEYLSGLVILGALLVAVMIAFLSEFGVHPDEYDVRVCLDWCMDKLIWPDMRLEGAGLGDTYSGYGFTKVCNNTPYFLIFSKVAWIFMQFMGDLPYYRMPNLLLMIFMTVYMLKNVRKRNYLMLGFGICVQAWYLFSYVTFDAEDYLLAFISIDLLADEDGYLWKTLKAEDRCVGRCLLLGVMYGILMLAKWTYYASLALTFLVLVVYLFKSEFNFRKQLFCKYLIIAGTAVLIFGARVGLDVHYYGFDKAEVKLEMEEKWCDYDKKPSTPEEEKTEEWRLHSRGYGISRVFELEPRWFIKSFRSMASARITGSGDDAYYILVFLLVSIIYVLIGMDLFKNGQFWIFLLGTGLNLVDIAASIVFSYNYEVQPQGRYLLPIVITTCYMGAKARGLWKDNRFKAAVLAVGILSVAYFGLFDSRKLIDLAMGRPPAIGDPLIS